MNVLVAVELIMAQVDGHVRVTLISQLFQGILRVLRKLLKCFKGTSFLTSFVLSSAGVLPLILL